jgi:hypothetical protein
MPPTLTFSICFTVTKEIPTFFRAFVRSDGDFSVLIVRFLPWFCSFASYSSKFLINFLWVLFFY